MKITDIPTWLKDLRLFGAIEGPLSHSQFAEKTQLNWDKTIGYKTEAGLRTLRADEFIQICDVFNISILSAEEIMLLKSEKYNNLYDLINIS